MVKIKDIIAREIIDSRGNPTIEVEVELASGIKVREQVPSGASTGKHEALEIRDGTKRFFGLGVRKAIRNVMKIKRKLVGYNLEIVHDIVNIDKLMIKLDGTANKSKLGANAILGVSLAITKAISEIHNEPLYITINKLAKHIAKYNYLKFNLKPSLPFAFMNIINGGKHADNGLSFQEFMIVPYARTFKERLRIGSEVYHELKSVIRARYGENSTNVGDEGGFAPKVRSYKEALNLLIKTIENLNYYNKIKLAIDVAATSFYRKGLYYVNDNGIKRLRFNDLAKIYHNLICEYPIISIEDPLHEDDFIGFSALKKELIGVGELKQIVGDDLLVTNPERIKYAISKDSCNALLLKVNQIGTVSEAIYSALIALNNDWNVMVSHRSGETESTFISHLATGLGCGQIKAGAPARGERTCKYNELLRIEESIRKRS